MAIGAASLTPETSLALMRASQNRSESAVNRLGPEYDAKAADAATEFESVFISEMLKPMFEEIKVDGMFGGGRGEEIFRGLLVQEYGKMIAHEGGVGLSSQIKEQIIKMQEQANNVAKN